jgi:hypothetical protein
MVASISQDYTTYYYTTSLRGRITKKKRAMLRELEAKGLCTILNDSGVGFRIYI